MGVRAMNLLPQADKFFLESARRSQQHARRELDTLYANIEETRRIIHASRKLLDRLAATSKLPT
jgi:hypothetical protein